MSAHALECQRTWRLNMAKTVFAITTSFLAISSIFHADDEGELIEVLSVLCIARHRRKHAHIQGFVMSGCVGFPVKNFPK